MQQKRFRTLVAAAALVAGGLLTGTAHADHHGAAMVSNPCAGCHGTDGNANGPAMPTIAGMPKQLMIDLMNDFASGDRPSTIMQRVAKGYSADQIDKLAGFFAAQTFMPAERNSNLRMGAMVDSKMADAGAKVAKKCGKCHEDNGKSTEDDTARLAGQWLDYLLIQVENYKENPDYPMPKKMKNFMDPPLIWKFSTFLATGVA